MEHEFEYGERSHFCIACTSKQKHNVKFKSDVFRCLICGSKLVDHEPTGAEIAKFRLLDVTEHLEGNNQTLCRRCTIVYPLLDFTECPNCYTVKHGANVDLTPILKPKPKSKSREDLKREFDESLEIDPTALWGDDKAPVTMEPKKI